MRLSRFLPTVAAIACLLAWASVPFVGGCAPNISPQAQAQVSQAKSDTAVAVAKAEEKGAVALATAKAAAAVAQAKGAASPVTHPIAAANNLVVELRPWLIAVVLVSWLLWAIEFGLSFTSLSFLTFLAPVFRWVAILSLAALIALPFMPVGLLAILAALIGLLVYELVKDKGNVEQAIQDTESALKMVCYPIAAAPIAVELNPATSTTSTTTTTTTLTTPPPAKAA